MYYGRQYPAPPVEEVWFYIKRAKEDFMASISKIEGLGLLDDKRVPDYVSRSISSAMDDVLAAFERAEHTALMGRSEQFVEE
jgi:hypothetical protein